MKKWLMVLIGLIIVGLIILGVIFINYQKTKTYCKNELNELTINQIKILVCYSSCPTFVDDQGNEVFDTRGPCIKDCANKYEFESEEVFWQKCKAVFQDEIFREMMDCSKKFPKPDEFRKCTSFLSKKYLIS